MKNVASLFTQEARAALENQLGIALSDGHDYSDEELGGLYERITEEFPYSFDENGEPMKDAKVAKIIDGVYVAQ